MTLLRSVRGSSSSAPEILEARVAPATLVWVGDVDGNWGTNNAGNTNWSSNLIPQDGDILSFPLVASNRTNVNNISGLDLVQLVFGGTDYVINGQAITLSAGISDGSSAGANELSVDIGLTSDQVFSVTVASSRLTIEGAVSGAFGVTKAGVGTVRYAGTTSNTYTGTTQVNAGTLELQKAGGVGGSLTAIEGPLNIGDGGGGQDADIVRLLASNQIDNAIAVSIASTGLLDLNNSSDSVGSLSLVSGTDIGAKVSTGTGTLGLNGNITVTQTGTGSGFVSINGNLNLGETTRTISVGQGIADPDFTITGVISGATDVGLIKTGAGTLRFAGAAANTYTGTTTVIEGVLELAHTTSVPGALVIGAGTGTPLAARVAALIDGAFAPTASVLVKTDGGLFTTGSLATIASLTLETGVTSAAVVNSGTAAFTVNGPIQLNVVGGGGAPATITGNLNLGGETRTFDIGNGAAAADLVISAVITNGSLTKSGAGFLQLSGANTYTGTTTITQGTVEVTGSLAGPVSLDGGTLVGTGTVGAVSGTGAGTSNLAPGRISVPNQFNTGSLTLNSATTLQIDVNGLTPATQHDRLVVTGDLSLAAATLDLSATFIPAVGNTFIIIQNDGSDAVNGTFSGLAEGAIVGDGTAFFSISYVGGDGNDVVLTAAIPEVTLIAGGKAATYTDVDGDLITIKTTRGTFDDSNFELAFVTGPNGIGVQLQRLVIADDVFKGTNLTITAKAGKSGGDGFVNVGFIDATNRDLGKVSVAGDLGRIVAGDGDPDKAALLGLTVNSMGQFGLGTQAAGSDLVSILNGRVGNLIVLRNIDGARFSVIDGADGSIASVTIRGSLIGGFDDFAGSIVTEGAIGKVTIGRDILGGSDNNAGAIIAGGNLGPVKVAGSLVGGFDDGTGAIVSTGGSIKSVSIGGSVVGGKGIGAGLIAADAQLGAVKVKGDITGFLGSGVIISGGGLAEAPTKGTDLAIKSLSVGGTVKNLLVRAGYDVSSGDGVNADASIGAVKISGEFIKSSIIAGVAEGADGFFGSEDDVKLSGAGVRDNSELTARIASVTVKGQAVGTAASLQANDAFGIVAEQIGTVKIGRGKLSLTTGIDIIGFGSTADLFAREDV